MMGIDMDRSNMIQQTMPRCETEYGHARTWGCIPGIEMRAMENTFWNVHKTPSVDSPLVRVCPQKNVATILLLSMVKSS